MKDRLKPLFLLPLSLVPAGCAEPTLRDGLWELSYLGVKKVDKKNPELNGMKFPIPRKLAEVQLGKGPNGTEMAEINFVEAAKASPEEGAAPEERPEAPVTPQQTPRSMFGDIRRAVEGNPPTIHIEDRDSTWIWRMWGVIVAPEEIQGTHFSALQRADSGAGCEGQWRMRWLGEK